MPDRIIVRWPAPDEEMRALAEVVADLHYGMSIVVEHAGEFVPGEYVDELRNAWGEGGDMAVIQLVRALDPQAIVAGPLPPPGLPFPPPRPLPPPPPLIAYPTLADHQLTGPVGKAKRSLASRLKDFFFGAWASEPRTPERTAQAAEAAVDWMECGETIVSSIPGWEKVEELVSLTKQLIGLRWGRKK